MYSKPSAAPKKGFSVEDILSSTATPVKRQRPGGPSTNGLLTPGSMHSVGASSSPDRGGGGNHSASSSRLISGGPSRLNAFDSSPASAGPSSPAIIVPFNSRPKPFNVEETLNQHLNFGPVTNRSDKPRVGLFLFASPEKYSYRYMYERLMERSEVLDSSIDEAADNLKAIYQVSELGDPGVQSQDEIIAVGRICPESDITKLTDKTTWLESSRMLGSGSRVLLQFNDDIKVRGAPKGSGGLGVFPGAMVGVRGRNGGGKVFSVSELIMMPPIDASYSAPSELLRNQYGTANKQLAGGPMSVIVAAGPYTVDSDLEYAPLEALLKSVQKEKPDLLVLLGPFVDSEHPLLKIGDVDQTPNEIFRNQISARLETLLANSKGTAIILIPNARDLNSSHVAYPQSPLMKDELGLPKAVKLLPNPATFSVNEVVFGITSVDVLFHIRNQEMFRPAIEVEEEGMEEDENAKGIMERTCRHLLRQRSYYPIFPAPLPSKSINSLNLDITHNDLIRMNKGPDVMILPSILKHFAKTVDSTVMINPSFLTRGNAPGTFARITIGPMDRSILEDARDNGIDGGEKDEGVEHRVWSRCKVQIVKV